MRSSSLARGEELSSRRSRPRKWRRQKPSGILPSVCLETPVGATQPAKGGFRFLIGGKGQFNAQFLQAYILWCAESRDRIEERQRRAADSNLERHDWCECLDVLAWRPAPVGAQRKLSQQRPRWRERVAGGLPAQAREETRFDLRQLRIFGRICLGSNIMRMRLSAPSADSARTVRSSRQAETKLAAPSFLITTRHSRSTTNAG